MEARGVSALRLGVVYFALVFGAGFLLGAIRVPFLVPRLGERWAELVEMPFMLVVIVIAARFVTRRAPPSMSPSAWMVVGVTALSLLLAAEALLAMVLARGSLAEYVASRDPVSGTVYLIMLVVFAAMPLAVARRAHRE